MKKAKLSDVPKMYRRNRWQEFLDLLLMGAISFGIVVSIIFIFVVF